MHFAFIRGVAFNACGIAVLNLWPSVLNCSMDEGLVFVSVPVRWCCGPNRNDGANP